MLPDVLGYKIEEGIKSLCDAGVDSSVICTEEYYSPKVDIIGNDKRIVRVKKKNNRIILTVSNF